MYECINTQTKAKYKPIKDIFIAYKSAVLYLSQPTQI